MKAIKIAIVACALGIFATSCRNKDCNDNTSMNETVAPAEATAVNDGTQTQMSDPADTTMQNAERESARTTGATTNAPGKRRTVNDNTSANNQSARAVTPAENVDLEAVKKREENFTHGTGAEYPGR